MGDKQKMRILMEHAVFEGDKNKILELIQKGIELDNRSVMHYFWDKEMAILHIVFENRDLTERQIIEVLQIFLDRGVDPNITNGIDDITVLQMAVARRMKNVIEFLKNRGANLDVRAYDGNSIAHFFIKYESKKLREYYLNVDQFVKIQKETANFIDWLASAGFDFDSKNHSNLNPLHLAISSSLLNWLHVVPTLLKCAKHLDLKDERNKMLLHSFLRSLNELRNSTNDSGKFLTSNYVTEVVKVLLDKGIPIDAENFDYETAVLVAIRQKENANMLKMLIDRFMAADDRIYAFSPIMINYIIGFWNNAESYTYSQIIRSMISRYPNALRSKLLGRTPIQQAVETSNFQLVQLLKGCGADLSALSRRGENLLHFAGANHLIEFLLKEGINIDGIDNEGKTPLCIAITKGRSNSVTTFLTHGANVNHPMTVNAIRQKLNTAASTVLLQHIIKMCAVGSQFNKDYQSMIDESKFDDFRKRCQEEVEILKTHFIDDSISLLHFLQINRNRKCAFESNEKLKKLVNDKALKNAFPNYSCLIETSYSQAVARKPLLESAESAWYKLTKIDLPSLCVNRILLYLSNKDLNIMVRSPL